MDYYSKYQKYKLKFLNLRNQIGGVIIWQYQIHPGAEVAGDDPANWEYYTPEESQIIESHDVGIFKLPSKFTINKINSNTGYQEGLSNRRNIKRTNVDDNTMYRIVEASRFLKTIRRFPRILEQDPNSDRLRSNLMDIFNTNGGLMSLGWDWPDAHISQYIVLYQEIIRLRKPLERITLRDILRLMNVFFPMQSEQEIEQERRRREAEDEERRRREAEDEYPSDDTYGNGMYGRL